MTTNEKLMENKISISASILNDKNEEENTSMLILTYIGLAVHSETSIYGDHSPLTAARMKYLGLFTDRTTIKETWV